MSGRRSPRAGSLGVGALIVGLGVLGALALSIPGAAAGASSSTQLKVIDAHVGNRSLMSGTTDNPVVIDPNARVVLSMTVRNDGPDAALVRYLRLSGSLIGIRFANFQGSANVAVLPGATQTVSVRGDFFDVDKVANGYVNGTMQLVDEQRQTLASQSFDANITGSWISTEGLLLAQVFLFALISLVDIGFGLARRRLPRNRFVRGILFALAAASTVMTLVILAAMAAIALFDASAWVPALLVATGGGFVLGYLSPGRLERSVHEQAEDKVIDLVAAGAVARASGEFARRTTGEVTGPESGDHSVVSLSPTGENPAHHSGEFAPAPSHESGEFSPAPTHESGSHEPLA